MIRGKWLTLALCLVCFVTAHAPAQEIGRLPEVPPPGEPPVKDLTPPGFADIVPPPPPHGDHPEIPGHLAPIAPGYAGFYGTAEYLLFRPHSDSLDFAVHNPSTGLATMGNVASLHYDLGSGVRTEVGYRFASGWDAGFAYTYLNTSGNRSITTNAGHELLPTLTRPGLTDVARTASATATLNYNLYDMVFGKRFIIDEHVAFRGYAGFRFADISQQFNAFYNGADARQAAVRTHSGFDGFGPMLGGELVAGGWHGFHFYARGNGGILTGSSCNSLYETNDAGGTVYTDAHYSMRKAITFGSIGIGGGWQYRMVSIRAGYEVTQFSGIFQPLRFSDDVSQGKLIARPANLSLEGFFLQFGLTF